MLAPGFEAIFSGNVSSIGGTIAADEFSFAGAMDMHIKGSIVSYGNEDFLLSGGANIVFDKESAPTVPVGFTFPGQFGEIDNSYQEY